MKILAVHPSMPGLLSALIAFQTLARPAADPPRSLPEKTTVLRGLAFIALGHERNKLDLYLPLKPSAPPLGVGIHLSKEGPPCLILHGDRDFLVPRGPSEPRHAALQAAGGDSTSRVMKGAGHGMGAFRAREAPNQLAAFFPRRLKQSALPSSAGGRRRIRIFSGEPRTVIVNGYSTSFFWWAMLRRKIDRYLGDAHHGVVQVRPALKGGTPVAKWMHVETGQPREPWKRILRPAIQQAKGHPVLVLCQQSLQWAFGDRRQGVRNRDDRVRIERGGDILEAYAKQILADGADEVWIAMHIYKRPMEPEIGNERLALDALMKRGHAHIHRGPDVWTPTRKLYPRAFARDHLHPNSIGAEIMAQLWFETLLAFDELPVPEWSREEMQKAIESPPVNLRGQGSSRSLRGR